MLLSSETRHKKTGLIARAKSKDSYPLAEKMRNPIGFFHIHPNIVRLLRNLYSEERSSDIVFDAQRVYEYMRKCQFSGSLAHFRKYKETPLQINY